MARPTLPEITLHVAKNILQVAGAPARTLNLFRPLDPDDLCQQFNTVKYVDGEQQQTPLKARQQLDWVMRCYDDPYHRPYIMYLSDHKKGDIARALALALISAACKDFDHKYRARPKWVFLHQGFDSQVPIGESDGMRPAFLVLDNVYVDSTPTKVEKLRDILAFYQDTPIVVINSSQGSPLAISEQFSLPSTYAALLQDARTKVKEEEI